MENKYQMIMLVIILVNSMGCSHNNYSKGSGIDKLLRSPCATCTKKAFYID